MKTYVYTTMHLKTLYMQIVFIFYSVFYSLYYEISINGAGTFDR